MPNKCCVPKCKSGFATNPEKVSMFSGPSDPLMQKKWTKAIPRAKYVVTKSTSICAKHFTPQDIIISSSKTADKMGRKRLKPGAIPTQFPGLPGYFSKKQAKPRKVRDRSTLSPIIAERSPSYIEIEEVDAEVNNSLLLDSNQIPLAQDPLSVDEVVPQTLPALPLQEEVNAAEPVEALAPAVFIIVHPQLQLHQVETSINHSLVSLPKDWLAFKLPSDIPNENGNESWMYLQFNMTDRDAGNFKTDKGIKVSGKNLIYYVMNKPYQGNLLPVTVNSVKELNEALVVFDGMKICTGVQSTNRITARKCVKGKFYNTPDGDYWRAYECTLIFPNNRGFRRCDSWCESCYILDRYLKRHKAKDGPQQKPYQKLNQAKRKISRRDEKLVKMRDEIRKLKSALANKQGRLFEASLQISDDDSILVDSS